MCKSDTYTQVLTSDEFLSKYFVELQIYDWGNVVDSRYRKMLDVIDSNFSY